MPGLISFDRCFEQRPSEARQVACGRVRIFLDPCNYLQGRSTVGSVKSPDIDNASLLESRANLRQGHGPQDGTFRHADFKWTGWSRRDLRPTYRTTYPCPRYPCPRQAPTQAYSTTSRASSPPRPTRISEPRPQGGAKVIKKQEGRKCPDIGIS